VENSPHGTTGPQNSPRWHENGEGAGAVLTDGSNDWSRGGDELAMVMKQWRFIPSADNMLEAKWNEVGGQDECGGERWCLGCLL
jgi:hypothetical protein